MKIWIAVFLGWGAPFGAYGLVATAPAAPVASFLMVGARPSLRCRRGSPWPSPRRPCCRLCDRALAGDLLDPPRLHPGVHLR